MKLMIAYRLHFEPCNLFAMNLVDSGKLGEPRLFHSVFTQQVRAGEVAPELVGVGRLPDQVELVVQVGVELGDHLDQAQPPGCRRVLHALEPGIRRARMQVGMSRYYEEARRFSSLVTENSARLANATTTTIDFLNATGQGTFTRAAAE